MGSSGKQVDVSGEDVIRVSLKGHVVLFYPILEII